MTLGVDDEFLGLISSPVARGTTLRGEVLSAIRVKQMERKRERKRKEEKEICEMEKQGGASLKAVLSWLNYRGHVLDAIECVTGT